MRLVQKRLTVTAVLLGISAALALPSAALAQDMSMNDSLDGSPTIIEAIAPVSDGMVGGSTLSEIEVPVGENRAVATFSIGIKLNYAGGAHVHFTVQSNTPFVYIEGISGTVKIYSRSRGLLGTRAFNAENNSWINSSYVYHDVDTGIVAASGETIYAYYYLTVDPKNAESFTKSGYTADLTIGLVRRLPEEEAAV